MGEKIRDIKQIHLTDVPLMVELNEGYTKDQGKVIHIQNDKFRYLLTVDDYIKAASLIMRGKVEFDYIKNHYKINELSKDDSASEVDLKEFELISVLNRDGVDYRVLDAKPKLVTLLINPDSKFKWQKKLSVQKLPHPYGEENGYTFLYQMKPFEMYEHNGYYYEIMRQVPCSSLTPKTWIPLDKIIQKSVWENACVKDGIKHVTSEDRFIYLISQAIFQKRCFSDKTKKYLEENSQVLQSPSFKAKTEMVVFGFFDRLTGHLAEKNYNLLIEDYYSYSDY